MYAQYMRTCSAHTYTYTRAYTAHTTQAADLATAIASADGKVTVAGVNDMLARERDRMPKVTERESVVQPMAKYARPC